MIILITGATGGIGREITKILSKKHSIIATSNDTNKLQELKKENKNIKIISADISKQAAVKKLFFSITKLDALINTAAILKPVGNFLENDLNLWKKNIEVNLLGTVYINYYAIPFLLKSKKGKIINFAGGGSAFPRPFHSAYASSKAAVVRFSETIAKEYRSLDINIIAPGVHNTKMWEDEVVEEKPKKWADKNALLAFLQFLLSYKSNGISGKFIHYKDDWTNFRPNISKKDIYTLRRIEK